MDKTMASRLTLIWLLVSEAVLVCSLLFWYIGFVFSFEIGWMFAAFVGSYPIFAILSAVMAWRAFKQRTYQKSLLWSLFPFIWYMILNILLWLE